MGCKLPLITNRKSHIAFDWYQNWLTLNDLKRRNGRNFALFYRTEFGSFRANYVKVLTKLVHCTFVDSYASLIITKL